MSKKFIKLLLTLSLCASFLINWADPAKAQGKLSLPTSVIAEKSKTFVIQADPNIVTWEMLGFRETNLVGPFDSAYFSFGLPADWKLTEGALLNLSLGISASTGVQNQTNSPLDQPGSTGVIGGGTLTVYLNNITLAILPLDQIGEVEKIIQIPVEAFSASSDGIMDLGFVLNTGSFCNNYYQMSVLIRTSSFLTLPHEVIQPLTDLLNFPRPIFQDSFIPDATLLVIPDLPSAGELRAALTVAAGLEKLSDGAGAIDMVVFSKLTTEQKLADHLIFIGNSGSLPVLGQLQLPLPIQGGKFQSAGDASDDGFVEMVNSPFNNAKVILVVSGNTDQGTIKAAQAVSSGVFRPSKFPNLAVVQEVQTIPIAPQQPTDQTLTSLGYQGRLFESRGVGSVSYNFNVPPGWTVASDASFELVFGNSALINYDTSGIVVLLNDNPIGSIRMSDVSASLSTNKVLINIPASAVIPGKNRLELRVSLLPHDECAPQNMRGLWVNIWPESTLHLPLQLTPITAESTLDLALYPAPFIYYPLLDNTAFVLMHNDLESWRAALKIAGYLGSRANGPVTALNVYYGDELPEVERSKYNLLIIGRPSQMPAVMGVLNKTLPIPFLEGSDVIADENFQVTYRIPPDSPMGYLEILPSPWNSENVILTILGNTPEGLSWASASLTDSDLRTQLAGNFAVINNKQIITADTRLAPAIKAEPTQAAAVVVLPPNVDANSLSPAPQQTTWVLPLFAVSVILIILLSAFAAIGRWSRNRTRGNMQRGGDQSSGLENRKWFTNLFKKVKNRQKDE